MSENPVRILLVEDNPSDARLVEEMLRDGGSTLGVVQRASSLSEALAIIDEKQTDVVLLDLSLPDSTGFDTFARLSAHAPELPVIVLSGLVDENMALRTVHEGAQDYLVKGRIEPDLLVRAIRYALERRRSEIALAREHDLLHALLDHLPDRVYFKDRNSRYIRINPALARFFKIAKPEDAIGKSDADFFSAERAQTAVEDECYIMRTGDAIVGKMEKETLPDGSTGWALVTKMALRDRHGHILGTTGISRDVTAIKHMEETLAAERNVLRSVIDNLPDPIFVKDAEGHYVLDNVAHTRSLGVSSSQEVIGKTSFDFFPPELAREFKVDDDRIIRTGEPLLNHVEAAPDANGNERWVMTTKVPVRAEADHVSRLVCIRRDITEQKLAQERLRQTNAELSSALANLKRTTEQLRDLQLELIEAEKMKSVGRLAAGVAHEVKNPLAVITMGVEYLTQQPLGEDTNVPMVLKDMSDAVKRADNVIRGLLDFSAPSRLELKPDDLNEVIERSLVLVRGEMKGVRLVEELQPNLPPLRMDRSKIEQVLINVFTNAAHAMSEGGTLLVRTYAKQLTGVGANIADSRSEMFRAGDTVVVLETEDTGSGIPEDKITKIFDPFFTTKPTGKGTGLGLTVTRSIIDLHGGTIAIANRPEGGAKVTIMFKAN